jgi:hypothetical protein
VGGLTLKQGSNKNAAPWWSHAKFAGEPIRRLSTAASILSLEKRGEEKQFCLIYPTHRKLQVFVNGIVKNMPDF